jgi:hypothetical protein
VLGEPENQFSLTRAALRTRGAQKQIPISFRSTAPSLPPSPVETGSWDYMFRILTVYQRTHGHCDVPVNERPGSLGHWLRDQLAAAERGKLTKRQRQRLQTLGVVLDSQVGPHPRLAHHDELWEIRFTELLAYKQRFGHTCVPAKWLENKPLGAWVHVQRAFRKRGILSSKRIARLEAIGFAWVAPGNIGTKQENWNKAWRTMYERLQAYRQWFGHCQVPAGWAEDPALAKWVQRQRTEQGQGCLPAARKAELDACDFNWHADHRLQHERWQHHFEELIAFKARFAHTRIPSKWKENKPLGAWVHCQRAFRKKGLLSAERVARLNGIGFEWIAPGRVGDTRQANWDNFWRKMFDDLKLFRERHGHCRVRLTSPAPQALVKWVQRQRIENHKGRLRPDRKALLESCGFAWEDDNQYRNDRWQRRFEELVAFKTRFGHTLVPADWAENKPLGAWVYIQRDYRRKSCLAGARIARLDSIGFAWTVPGRLAVTQQEENQLRWDRKFEQLRQFKEQHGHCRPSKLVAEYRSLAEWVQGQRQRFREGGLEVARKERLDAIGFDWNPQRQARVGGLTPEQRAAWRAVQAVRRQKTWGRRIAELTAFGQQHNHIDVPTKTPLGRWLAKERIAARRQELTPEQRQALADLGVDWSPLETVWDRHFQNLHAFHGQHLHFHVPRRYAPDPDLACWQHRQRYLHRRGRLREDRRQKLEALGWSSIAGANPRPQVKWEARFAELLAFKQRHGHYPHSTRHGRTSLGIWLGNQRQFAAKGKLAPDRRQLLEQAGVPFGRYIPHKWEARYAQLSAFAARHGHCHVPDDLDHHKLFNWVIIQRTARRRGKLSLERTRFLDAIGFTWNASAARVSPTKIAYWDLMYDALAAYQKQHGHTLVPFHHLALPPARTTDLPSKPLPLGRWVTMQRQALARDKMKPERRRRLDLLGFAWNAIDAVWDSHLQALKEFQRQHGHCQVTTRHNRDLAIWVCTLRQRRKDGELSVAKIRQLDDLGFAWQALDLRWERRFSELLQYQQMHGHCNVPAHWESNPALAEWVDRQRRTYARGTLRPEYARRLAAIRFAWKRSFRHNTVCDARWDKILKDLTAYQRRHGAPHVTPASARSSKLAHWLFRQRRCYLHGEMSADRARRLKALGFLKPTKSQSHSKSPRLRRG